MDFKVAAPPRIIRQAVENRRAAAAAVIRHNDDAVIADSFLGTQRRDDARISKLNLLYLLRLIIIVQNCVCPEFPDSIMQGKYMRKIDIPWMQRQCCFGMSVSDQEQVRFGFIGKLRNGVEYRLKCLTACFVFCQMDDGFIHHQATFCYNNR